MAIPPSTLTYGTVTGTFVSIVADGASDTDAVPEVVPVTGKVTFTPSIDRALVRASGVGPFAVSLRPIVATIDNSGVLTINAKPGVQLLATNDALITPRGFTWTVTFSDLTDLNGPITIAPFSIEVPAGQTTDLAVAAAVPSSGGTALVPDARGIELLRAEVIQRLAEFVPGDGGTGGGGGAGVDQTARNNAETARQLAASKYLKPADGIPQSDISTAAQAALKGAPGDPGKVVGMLVLPAGTTTIPAGTAANTLVIRKGA